MTEVNSAGAGSYLLRLLCTGLAVQVCLFAWSRAVAAQEVDPRVEQHLEAAQQAQAQQDCGTAAREYAAAVHLMPTSAELWSNEGVAFYCAEDLPSAISAFEKAKSLNPR